MRLSALAGSDFSPDPDITGLTADSRAVKHGYLFAALKGEHSDGVQYIPQAEENGAAAILAASTVPTSLPIVIDAEPRRKLASMAAAFFPRQPETIIGITGTNGKTSTARFASQLLQLCGRKAGSLGTLGAVANGFDRQLGFTTPEPVALHETLNEMTNHGVTHLAMEVSSHGLAQYRADGVRFAVAAFTNITQDHLDFHDGFDDYREAKMRLFSTLLGENGTAVINADGEGAVEFAEAARSRGIRVIATGAHGDDIKLKSASPTPTGIEMQMSAFGADYDITLPLTGLFQAENALLAAGIVIACGENAADVIPLLEKLHAVPGRMQLAATTNGGAVYVDYAHTPDAIETALRAIRPHAAARVVAVIGAGGDRDKGKRPLMGKAASEYADIVIVTDDNPRTEDPAEIRAGVLAGCEKALEIGDRGKAIATGVAMLEPGDVLIIAGKGHETGQVVGAETLPFDDAAIAQQAAGEREKELGR